MTAAATAGPAADRAAAAHRAVAAWHDLVATALVGTERRPLPAEVPAAVRDLLGGTPPAEAAEERVLDAAGALGAWRRAGWTPPEGALPVPPAAPADDRPVASATALQLLDLLLGEQVPVVGNPMTLVAEWLERCADAGRRLPREALPRLLAGATAAPRCRDAALRTGGPPLRWLAGRNPAWTWAREEEAADAGAVWATGTRDDRVEALARLRRRDPARALELLAGTWADEPAGNRGRFVEVLWTGLSPDDEPFLEAALDDRARAVRGSAAAMLASLTGSALAGRMAARLDPLVTTTGGRRRRLEVALPGSPDMALQRDGVSPLGAPDGVGPSGWVIQQVVAAAPLAWWEERLDATPEDVVALGAQSPPLLAGWAQAAVRQRDPAWALALLRRRTEPALLGALPPEVAHRELEALVARAPDRDVQALLSAAPRPWPPATSTAVLDRLRRLGAPRDVLLVVPVLASGLDPAARAAVSAWADALPAADRRTEALRALAATLSIRATIAQELA